MGFVNNQNGFARVYFQKNFSGYPVTMSNFLQLRSLSVSGSTMQDGTPAPDNPVEIEGVGERTENLLNYQWGNLITNPDGTISTATNYYSSIIDVTDLTNIYISGDFSLLNSNSIRIGLCTEMPIAGATALRRSMVANGTIGVSAYNYAVLSFLPTNSKVTIEDIKKSFMVNKGNTAAEYEPYGYKVPLIISKSDGATQTFPIYLDNPLYGNDVVSDTVRLDVEKRTAILTRRYNTLVFDGTEEWKLGNTTGRFDLIVRDAERGSQKTPNAMSNYYKSQYGVLNNNIFVGAYNDWITIIDTRFSAADEFKSWLSEQYAAGTPVITVYKIKTPVTTDISDAVDWGSIPTLYKGTVIITADTIVFPSSIGAIYKSTKM